MATIEPRLIHLLNDEPPPPTPEPCNVDLYQLPSLPSLQLPTLGGTREGPLPPLPLDGLRSDRFFGSSGRYTTTLPSINGGGHVLASSPGADHASPDRRGGWDYYGREGKYAGSAGVFPLRLLLSDVPPSSVTAPAMSMSFSSILNDDEPNPQEDDRLPSLSSLHASGSSAAFTAASTSTISYMSNTSAATSISTTSAFASTCTPPPPPAAVPIATTSAFASACTPPPPAAVPIAISSFSTAASKSKKRPAAVHVKDDFLQLPQPAKKHRAHQAPPLMPPIINGLLEPPPNVALFPPMSSSAFDDTDAGQPKLSYSPPGCRLSPEPDRPMPKPKPRRRSSRPRRRWSEEETTQLLRAVDRHGVGKWTNILDDPEFSFNSRSASDLKDRFRTCCPEEMRVTDGGKNTKARAKTSSPKKPDDKSPDDKSLDDNSADSVMADAGDALLNQDQQASPASPVGVSDDQPLAKRTRAHRKKVSDLEGLGIKGPFKRARRRERTTFTNRDDQEILQGLKTYGPTWTKIQRDGRFHLGNRKPTDLRDRVRNKYPSTYQSIEKGVFQPQDVSTNHILEPMVNTTIGHPFKAAPTTQESSTEPQTWSFLVTNPSEQS
ncbi:hypothetical protein ACQKWADRAFT_301539 [Trichoderma austrokoningii]